MSRHNWLLKENFNQLDDLATGFTLDSMRFVGGLEVSKKYNGAKNAVENPGPKKRSLRFGPSTAGQPAVITITMPSGATAGNGDWLSFHGGLPSPVIPSFVIDDVQVAPTGPLHFAEMAIPFFDDSITFVNILSTDSAQQVAIKFLEALVLGGPFDFQLLGTVISNYYSVVNNGNGSLTLTALTSGEVPAFVTGNLSETGPGSFAISVAQPGMNANSVAHSLAHLQIVGTDSNIHYDSLEANFDVFFEAPWLSPENNGRHIGVQQPGDAYDVFITEDVTTIKLGKLTLQFSQNTGNPDSGTTKDGFTVLSAKVGDSPWQTRNLGYIRHKWLQLRCKYNGQKGTATVRIELEHKAKYTLCFSGLTNLSITSRSNDEFQFQSSWTVSGVYENPSTISQGALAGLQAGQNVYMDNMELRVINSLPRHEDDEDED
jgi:hypothetical protein